ncbi:hypothetical protein TrRE_jg2080, partial [Triparma retinervis]
MRSKRVIVVGGTAGTGKSTIIREMKRIGGPQVTLLTSNNHQAASLGGFTCHSAFGCTPTKIANDPERFKKLENQKVVIIDESQQIPQNVVCYMIKCFFELNSDTTFVFFLDSAQVAFPRQGAPPFVSFLLREVTKGSAAHMAKTVSVCYQWLVKQRRAAEGTLQHQLVDAFTNHDRVRVLQQLRCLDKLGGTPGRDARYVVVTNSECAAHVSKVARVPGSKWVCNTLLMPISAQSKVNDRNFISANPQLHLVEKNDELVQCLLKGGPCRFVKSTFGFNTNAYAVLAEPEGVNKLRATESEFMVKNGIIGTQKEFVFVGFSKSCGTVRDTFQRLSCGVKFGVQSPSHDHRAVIATRKAGVAETVMYDVELSLSQNSISFCFFMVKTSRLPYPSKSPSKVSSGKMVAVEQSLPEAGWGKGGVDLAKESASQTSFVDVFLLKQSVCVTANGVVGEQFSSDVVTDSTVFLKNWYGGGNQTGSESQAFIICSRLKST